MKLIDKDALVAEIEKLVDKGKYHEEYDCAYRDGNNCALYALKDKLDTLEVKDVDLEKEIEKVWNTDFEDFGILVDDFYSIAKHFFELGLKVSNPLTWEDIDWIVGEAVCRVSEDSETEQICKEVLKRFKEQKGEKYDRKRKT